MLVALVGLGALTGSSSESGGSAGGSEAAVEEVVTIARRIERIRGQRFRRRPEPRIVSPAEVRREGLAELDRTYPAARRRADEELLKLLGLIEPKESVRKIQSAVFGEQVAGFYDTRRGRLSIVRGAGADDPVTAEITLAHELVHALEDQRFALEEPSPGAGDDAAAAYTALVEGTATSAMLEYVKRHVGAGEALGSALAAAGAPNSTDLPPYVLASFEFSYLGGASFVEELFRVAGDWRLVDLALRSRPPASTEQVLHPRKFLIRERPLVVRLSLGRALGPGWGRLVGETLGEFDTGQLIDLGAPGTDALAAAAGWGGGRYELWRRRGTRSGCGSPCTRDHVLALGWRWDSPAEAREFARFLPRYLEGGLKARRAGAGRWSSRGGGIATVRGERTTTLVFAPSPDSAATLAGAIGPR